MYYCRLCNRPMRQSRWGDWFEHIINSFCRGQWAYWAEEE